MVFPRAFTEMLSVVEEKVLVLTVKKNLRLLKYLVVSTDKFKFTFSEHCFVWFST